MSSLSLKDITGGLVCSYSEMLALAGLLFASTRGRQQGRDSNSTSGKTNSARIASLFSLLLSCALQIWTIAVVLYVARIKQQGLQTHWERLLPNTFSMWSMEKSPFFLSMPWWSESCTPVLQCRKGYVQTNGLYVEVIVFLVGLHKRYGNQIASWLLWLRGAVHLLGIWITGNKLGQSSMKVITYLLAISSCAPAVTASAHGCTLKKKKSLDILSIDL